jgi:hypothetical protein
MTAQAETTEAERIEADIRRQMALHAAIAPRGWQSSGDRAALHKSIDGLLDRWAATQTPGSDNHHTLQEQS